MSYTLDQAFEDISRAVVESGEPLDYDRRWLAAQWLHTVVRSGFAVGLPLEADAWPSAHPARWVVSNIRHAGLLRPVPYDGDGEPGLASSWALREAAAELQISLLVTDDQLTRMHPDVRAEERAERNAAQRLIQGMNEHADYMLDLHGADIPGPDELDDYDEDLDSLT